MLSILLWIYLNSLLFHPDNGRRRRHSFTPVNSPLTRTLRHSFTPVDSPLTRAVRQKRQVITSGNVVTNLYDNFNLPLSCCKSGGISTGNSLGGSEYFALH